MDPTGSGWEERGQNETSPISGEQAASREPTSREEQRQRPPDLGAL